MPRVEKDAQCTIVILTYRSIRWLTWCMDSIVSSKNQTRYRFLIVANDATEEVRYDPLIDIDWRNENPSEFYINRVYRAWNEGVMQSPTQLVCMLNSDMFASDGWLDELMLAKMRNPFSVPTSLLVESGRLPSGMPEKVRNFGMNPGEFDESGFLAHAAEIRQPEKLEPGRLYMPILIDRQEFIDAGLYPEGNPAGTTGDKDLIRRYAEAGFKHVTCMGSIVYHAVTGEQVWP